MPSSLWGRYARVIHAVFLLSCAGLGACSDGGSDSDHNGELSDEVSVLVGKKGATIKAKGVSLVIPEGALDKDVTITAKTSDKPVPQGKEAVSQVYEFGPAGTKFKKDVEVAFDSDKHERSDKASVYFTKEDDPSVFEKLVSAVSSDKKQVSAKVKHFSFGFAGIDLADTGGFDGGTDVDPGMRADGGTSVEPDAGGDSFDAGPQAHHIKVQSKDQYGVFANQTWAAYQDGDGAWRVLPAPSSTGVYEFDVRSDRYAVTFVCAQADGTRSSGVIHYEPSSTTSIDVAASGYCHTAVSNVVEYTLSGEFVRLGGTASGYQYGHAYAISSGTIVVGAGPPPYNFISMRQGEAIDVLALVHDSAFPTNFLKGWILRDQTLNQNSVGMDLDYDEGFMFGTSTVTINNASTYAYANVSFTMGGATQGLSLANSQTQGVSPRVQPYYTVPSNVREPSDSYRISITESQAGTYRAVDRYSHTGGDLVVTMPDYYGASLQLTSTPYQRPLFVFDEESVLNYRYGFTYLLNGGQTGSHLFDAKINPDWLPDEAQHTVEFPDFSALTGFNPSWFAPTGASVEIFAGVTRVTTSADGSETSVSQRMITLPPL